MKKILPILLSLTIILAMPITVFATSGKSSISISNSNPTVGEKFVVTVSSTVSTQLKVSYDSRVIEIVGSSVTGQSTSNSLSFSGTGGQITFQAKAEGKSGVILEGSGISGASINVPVSAAATPAPTEPVAQPEPAPQEPASAEPDTTTQAPSDGDFSIDGVSYVVSERYTKEQIPAGFSTKRLSINGKNVNELSNGTFTIIYLKPAADITQEGKFYIYDEGSGAVTKFSMLGNNGGYIIVTEPKDFFTKRLVVSDRMPEGTDAVVYSIEGSDSEFYYAYGMDLTGTEGWYVYDSLKGTVTRADVKSLSLLDTVSNENEPETENTTETSESQNEDTKDSGFSINPKFIIIGAIGFIVLIIIILIINSVLKRKEDDEDYYDDEDEYEDEDEDESEESEESELTEVIVPVDESVNVTDNQPAFVLPQVGISASKEREELIDELIKKASDSGDNSDMDIMDLNDF